MLWPTTTELQIWKLIDILKSLSCVNGMKLLTMFCSIFAADADIHR